MSAPVLWILVPGAASLLLWINHRRQVLTNLLAAFVCLLLGSISWLIPVEKAISLGFTSFEIGTTLVLLGRRFVLTEGDQPVLTLVFLLGAGWFFLANFVRTNRFFAPFGLAIMALLVAALAVEPFLFAALLIEIAILLSVPMIAGPGQEVSQGILRFVIFQTLAMPFILIAGWAAAGVEANPTNTQLLLLAVMMLGLGLAFWLAIFPFYSWVPLLLQDVNPYLSGFLLSMLQTVVLMLLLDFFNEYTWLREYPALPQALQLLGVLMVVTGGVWAAFQQNLARLFGYAVIMENGFALLSLSIGGAVGYEIFVAGFLARLLALMLWAVSLTVIRQQNGMEFSELAGLLKRMPVTSGAVVMACFSVAGLPILAAFPVREVLLEFLAQRSLAVTFWTGIGAGAMMLAGVRALAAMTKPTAEAEEENEQETSIRSYPDDQGEKAPFDEGQISAGLPNGTPGGDEPVGDATQRGRKWPVSEGLPQAVILGIGMALVILMGLLPGWFLPGVLRLLQSFEHLR